MTNKPPKLLAAKVICFWAYTCYFVNKQSQFFRCSRCSIFGSADIWRRVYLADTSTGFSVNKHPSRGNQGWLGQKGTTTTPCAPFFPTFCSTLGNTQNGGKAYSFISAQERLRALTATASESARYAACLGYRRFIPLANNSMSRSKSSILKACETTTEEGHKVFFSGKEDKHEHGVGFLVHKDIVNTVIGCRPVSSRLITIRLWAVLFIITIVQVHAPTSDYDDNETEEFYVQLQNVIDHTPKKDILVVQGD